MDVEYKTECDFEDEDDDAENKKARLIIIRLFYEIFQSRMWRPYGDSNPGYRRERASDRACFYIVTICKFTLMLANILRHRVNFRVLNVHIVGLFEYQNDQAKLKRDRSERLVLSKN